MNIKIIIFSLFVNLHHLLWQHSTFSMLERDDLQSNDFTYSCQWQR